MDETFLTMPAGGKILVRVDITSEQDTAYEGAEVFTLVASTTSGTTGTGIGTITDDGSGAVFRDGNSTATPNDPGESGYPALDDDRALVRQALAEDPHADDG